MNRRQLLKGFAATTFGVTSGGNISSLINAVEHAPIAEAASLLNTTANATTPVISFVNSAFTKIYNFKWVTRTIDCSGQSGEMHGENASKLCRIAKPRPDGYGYRRPEMLDLMDEIDKLANHPDINEIIERSVNALTCWHDVDETRNFLTSLFASKPSSNPIISQILKLEAETIKICANFVSKNGLTASYEMCTNIIKLKHHPKLLVFEDIPAAAKALRGPVPPNTEVIILSRVMQSQNRTGESR